VYNEEANLPILFARLYPVLDGLGRGYEIIFTNDGSADRSRELLAAQHAARPDVTRVIEFNANYGQHMAIIAAFERVRGQVVITLDADLQNPPEEIPKLLAATDAGHDCVGGARQNRQDSAFRRYASRMVNFARREMTNIEMTDQGCMLRAYSHDVVAAIVRSGAVNTFIPALAYTLSQNPTEVPVKHEERHAGVSNYSLYKLIRLNFDLITGFSLVPLQLFSMFGMLVAALALIVYVIVIVYRLIHVHPDDALAVFWDRDILAFFLVGMMLFGLGLIGEYVGRIYHQVRARPRYMVRAVLERPGEPAEAAERASEAPARLQARSPQ